MRLFGSVTSACSIIFVWRVFLSSPDRDTKSVCSYCADHRAGNPDRRPPASVWYAHQTPTRWRSGTFMWSLVREDLVLCEVEVRRCRHSSSSPSRSRLRPALDAISSHSRRRRGGCGFGGLIMYCQLGQVRRLSHTSSARLTIHYIFVWIPSRAARDRSRIANRKHRRCVEPTKCTC